MRLSVASWSFPMLSLAEVGGLAKATGFEAIDVGYFYRSSLDKARLLAEPEAYGHEIATALPVKVANLYHLFGNSPAKRNLASPDFRAENLADFRQALKFCKAVGAPSIFILPGVLTGQQSRADALAISAEALKPMVEAGAAAGIVVCIEAHVHSYLESPALAAELCKKAPGLKLALDYAHFVVSGYRQDEIDALAKYAGHVHLRQARPGALQTKMLDGVINFPAMFATLKAAGFAGWLACEYVHQAYFDTIHDDVLTETILMRDLFRAWNSL
ncbi:MAG: sugar phosphate isomerase/epimerase family protein [Devosia sp.]